MCVRLHVCECLQFTVRYMYTYTTPKISFNLKRYLPSNTEELAQDGGELQKKEEIKAIDDEILHPILLKRSVYQQSKRKSRNQFPTKFT